MSCLAIIPARGGSKRIPRKNIKGFLGKPIIAYSIEAALDSGIFDEVMVSTDDCEIAEVAREYGASVPFFRSAETSTDTAGTVPVLVEVLGEYAKHGKNFEYVCCIYPCAPFVTATKLREGMEMLVALQADSVFPVVKYSYPPQRCLVIRGERVEMLNSESYNMRTQDFEALYHDAGQFYFAKRESLLTEGKLYCKHSLPLVMPETEVQDIDSEEDWKIAEIKYQVVMRGSDYKQI